MIRKGVIEIKTSPLAKLQQSSTSQKIPLLNVKGELIQLKSNARRNFQQILPKLNPNYFIRNQLQRFEICDVFINSHAQGILRERI